MRNRKNSAYTPAELEIIPLEYSDILTLSQPDQEKDQNEDNDW